jgi:hypothetical protein
VQREPTTNKLGVVDAVRIFRTFFITYYVWDFRVLQLFERKGELNYEDMWASVAFLHVFCNRLARDGQGSNP